MLKLVGLIIFLYAITATRVQGLMVSGVNLVFNKAILSST